MPQKYTDADNVSFKLEEEIRRQLDEIAENRGGCSRASLLRIAAIEFIERNQIEVKRRQA